jgi:hypothetical protein
MNSKFLKSSPLPGSLGLVSQVKTPFRFSDITLARVIVRPEADGTPNKGRLGANACPAQPIGAIPALLTAGLGTPAQWVSADGSIG